MTAVLAALLGAAACADTPEVPLPASLIGRWTTADVDYVDRYFELRGDSIVLGTGGGTSERYSISRVLEMRDEEGLLYTIEYGNGADEFAMSFYFDARTSQLRLKNQLRMIWRKATG